MPPTKGNFRKYTQEAMQAAVEDVRLHKTPYKTAAKKFNVPRVTLKYKVEGKYPLETKMGPATVLSKDEETNMKNWIFEMAHAGFPVTMEQVVFSVQRLLKELNRPNPFKDNRPGKSWIKGFMKRNPDIAIRMAQNLTKTRADICKESLLNWFTEVKTYLTQNGQEHILQDPNRIFNTDESAFFLNPKGGKVLAKKGDKTVYQQVNPDEKECLTVLVTGSAGGAVPPPTVLFKYKRIPHEIAANFPPEWGLGKTDSGWMTCEAFYEFIADIFHPWLKKENIPLPVILFIDSHASHLSLQVSQFCEKNGIILIALYPNATHILQPMDVAVFRTVKEHWKERVRTWRLANLENPILRKKDFPKLLKEVMDVVLKPSILENGFRKCGIFPWNPEAIKLSIDPNNNNPVSTNEERKRFLKEGLCFLNKSINESKLDIFRNGNQNNELQEKDMSLFELWQNTKQELESISTFSNAPDLIHESANHSFEDMDVDNTQPGTLTSVPIDELAHHNSDPCLVGPSSASTKVPSPFKRHLFYQKDSEEPPKKRATKEKLPTIVSGRLCQEYFKRKLAKKEEIERRKMERVAERERKREEKEKAKQEKSQQRKKRTAKRVLQFEESSDSSIDEMPSGSEDGSNDDNDKEDMEIQKNDLNKPVERKVGEYVVFSYEEELFPGVIIGASKTAATISAMQKSGRLWKWPEKIDKLDYEWEAVLFHINKPVKTSTTRNVYSVPELDFRWK